MEVTNLNHSSGKSVLWYNFVKILYSGHERVEVPIGFLMLLSAILLARILSWIWNKDLRKTAIFLLIFICLTPHFTYFIGTLYPDGIYSVAATALLFEIWLIARYREINKLSILIIFITFPFAVFMRANGLVFTIPLVWLVYILWADSRKSAIWISAIILGWFAMHGIAKRIHPNQAQGAMYPLAIYETVNFLRHRPMNLWVASPRVSEKTIKTLEKYNQLSVYQEHFDPDYWDPLVFRQEGPKVMSLSDKDKTLIIKEFFRYNIWRNIPSFIGSRFNIFLSASFAQGGLPSHTYSQYIIPEINSKSVYRSFHLDKLEAIFFDIYNKSYKARWLFWTPFLGLILVFAGLIRGTSTRNIPLLLVAFPMFIQFAGIFLFSTAAEYRYILPFFTIPLVLLPALQLEQRGAIKV